MSDSSDGIWDDGEWIGWDWINGQLSDQELRAEYPKASLEIIRVFEDLVALAQEYYYVTGDTSKFGGNLESSTQK